MNTTRATMKAGTKAASGTVTAPTPSPIATTSGDLKQLSDLGPRGLVIYHNDQYYYAKEEDWRKSRVDAASAPDLAKLNAVVAKLASNEIFVNFDQLAELAVTALTNEATGNVDMGSLSPPAVVVREGNNHFAVTGWQPLAQGGDAGVLVNRGATVAVIPQNSIPSGTYCVLVNFHAFTE